MLLLWIKLEAQTAATVPMKLSLTMCAPQAPALL
jgi:hypothetical protein